MTEILKSLFGASLTNESDNTPVLLQTNILFGGAS